LPPVVGLALPLAFFLVAAEFVRLKVDIIVPTAPAAFAAKQATSTVPIVLAL